MDNTKISSGHNVVRRSANYKPTIWNFDYIESLGSEYVGEQYKERINELKGEVRMMLENEKDNPLAQLEQIDTLERLGLFYHFEEEIKSVLGAIHTSNSTNDAWKKNNLHATALEFRLLRQHGYWISSDVFNIMLKDETGNIKAMSEDIRGMLSLYEASFLLIKGESILEEATDFAAKSLERNQDEINDADLAILVKHALELPLHWRMPRLETRWYIDVYGSRKDMNSTFLELAKLDFNVVQSTHIEDLKHASRWWNDSRLGQKLYFARDRIVECFLWSVGVIFEPQFGYSRRMLTRIGALITVIDDVYDVHGTLDELELFGNAIQRWDINGMDQLPDYMKICFLATYNTVNGMVFDSLKEQDYLILECIKKVWADQCKSYMVEAKWYHSRYTPTLQEYIENGCISITTVMILVHLYFFMKNPITEEVVEYLVTSPSIIRHAAIICRLSDDLGTSSLEVQRGDNPKSIQCYMSESGVSEDEARHHIKFLITETRKQMNEYQFAESPFSQEFIQAAMNFCRISLSMYQNGDGYGAYHDRDTKDKVLSLLVKSISLE